MAFYPKMKNFQQFLQMSYHFNNVTNNRECEIKIISLSDTPNATKVTNKLIKNIASKISDLSFSIINAINVMNLDLNSLFRNEFDKINEYFKLFRFSKFDHVYISDLYKKIFISFESLFSKIYYENQLISRCDEKMLNFFPDFKKIVFGEVQIQCESKYSIFIFLKHFMEASKFPGNLEVIINCGSLIIEYLRPESITEENWEVFSISYLKSFGLLEDLTTDENWYIFVTKIIESINIAVSRIFFKV